MRQDLLTFNSVNVTVRRRRGQRSLKVHVRPCGSVVVTSGYSLPVKVIERFLNDSWCWVEQAKAKAALERAKHPSATFRDGELFLFLGRHLRLTFVKSSSARRSARLSEDGLEALVPPAEWKDFFPHDPHPEWQMIIRRFYRAEGERVLTERVTHFAQLMAVKQPLRLTFRCQRTRWGSCGPDGAISLNWRLIAAPPAVLDYVVIHELAHLTHPNHSSRFWRHVENYCATPKANVNWLRQNHRKFDFLLPSQRPD